MSRRSLNAAAGALELSDRALPDVRELSAGDPVEIRRFVDAYAPQPLAPQIAEPLSGASDVLGPAGFLERLSWYRDMLTRHACRGRSELGAAAAPLRARERFS